MTTKAEVEQKPAAKIPQSSTFPALDLRTGRRQHKRIELLNGNRNTTGRPFGSFGNLEPFWRLGRGFESLRNRTIRDFPQTAPKIGERPCSGYTKFGFTADEGKGVLNLSRAKKEGKHRRRQVGKVKKNYT